MRERLRRLNDWLNSGWDFSFHLRIGSERPFISFNGHCRYVEDLRAEQE